MRCGRAQSPEFRLRQTAGALMQLEFDHAKFPRRLNLGCGFDRRQGYLNVDLQPWHEPDLVADVSDLHFLPAGYYEEIVAQDVLEHLPRTSTCKVLVHWNRLLAPGGDLRLRVPNVVAILERFAAPENQSAAAHEDLIQLLFGTQAYTGDFHFTSFTEVLLRHYLQATGFDVVGIATMDDGNFDVASRKARDVHPHDVGDFSDLLGIPGDEDFVRECFVAILEREADAPGINYYVPMLAQARMVRRAVIERMWDSDERKALAGKRAA
jgi:predicted SAM-dependent methyltransferase